MTVFIGWCILAALPGPALKTLSDMEEELQKDLFVDKEGLKQ